MSETMPQSNSTDDREARYRRDYDPTPEWGDVVERIDLINVPEDMSERANDVAANFGQRGMDIEMVAQAMHQVLVPHIETVPTDFNMEVGSPDGSRSTVLMHPEDRAAFFDQAANLVRELNERRGAGDDEAFLARASNVSALSIVLAHPYANGNGRTARVIGGLLREGPQSEDLKVLGTERPTTGFRINSYLPRDESLTPLEVLQAAAALETPLSDSETYMSQGAAKFTGPYGP
jgi:hypothetical protein